jgi:hypothetical protein
MGANKTTEIVVTEEFKSWLLKLDKQQQNGVAQVVKLLEVKGTDLGAPYSSAIRGSKYALRELRKKTGSHVLRIFYAFDPKRQAVLLIGGDKRGKDQKKFYSKMTKVAEMLWEEYLEDMQRE